MNFHRFAALTEFVSYFTPHLLMAVRGMHNIDTSAEAYLYSEVKKWGKGADDDIQRGAVT
ncbi:hypothetical protein EYZ11_012735 [Aspergillus tanneri]|uniref:Uncharacterized protein n=1 Tax=Aspergillus tanneri TaxID=1220188 RepID=A0A4S3J4V5_9EURO|nr:hypothetical protein EYZ11_012735 [Aspergillus tanneri]